jgi:hypothetical protein
LYIACFEIRNILISLLFIWQIETTLKVKRIYYNIKYRLIKMYKLFNSDSLDVLYFFKFRDDHFQDTVLAAGLDILNIDVFRKIEAACKLSETRLDFIIVLFIDFFFEVALT